MSLGKPSGKETQEDAARLLQRIKETTLEDKYSLLHIPGRDEIINDIGQLLKEIARLEEKAGSSISEGIEVPSLSIEPKDAKVATECIPDNRLGTAHLIRAKINDRQNSGYKIERHQLETFGQLVAIIRSLEKIAELE